MIRTFIAVDISDSVRSAAGRWIDRLSRVTDDYRWSLPENLHVTLNFLGDVADSDIPNICKRIKSSVGDASSFEMSVGGLGAFPDNRRPRTIWMGIDDGTTELCAIQESLTDTLLDLGFPKDRHRYSPHLTLGRLRRGARWSTEIAETLDVNSDTQPITSHVNEVVVYSSFLDKSGPTYTPMSRIQLR